MTSQITKATHEEFDLLMKKAEGWPSHFNLAAIGGYLIQHPEIVNRPKCARVLSDEAYVLRVRR